jgi:hypothetical protein
VETTEHAVWDQRYSGPDLVWGAGPNRFVTEEVAALPAGRAVDLGTGKYCQPCFNPGWKQSAQASLIRGGVHEVAVRWTPLTRVTGRFMRGAGTGPRVGRPCPAVKSSLPARDGGEVGMGGSGTGGDEEPHDLVPVNGISGHDAAAIRA